MINMSTIKAGNPWRLAKPIESTSRKIKTQPYAENYFMDKSPLAKDYVPKQGSNIITKIWNGIKGLF